MAIRLNCDMGESFGIWKMGNDEEVMPYIDMANLACGFHASDAVTMSRSVILAKKYNVSIGAHPSYHDLLGFGRRTLVCSLEEIKAIILYQLGALNAFCRANGTAISYVKPHGALYNDMMRDENIFKAVLNAISSRTHYDLLRFIYDMHYTSTHSIDFMTTLFFYMISIGLFLELASKFDIYNYIVNITNNSPFQLLQIPYVFLSIAALIELYNRNEIN